MKARKKRKDVIELFLSLNISLIILMKDNELYFGKTLEEHVTILVGDTIELRGELRINPGKLPAVFFDRMNYSNSDMIAIKESNALINCHGSKHHYSLLNCAVYDGSIYPKYILSDYSQEYKITGFHIYLSGFNDWIDPLKGFDIDDDCIKKDISIPKFNLDVQIDGKRKVTFSNEYNCDIKQNKSNDRQTVVDEYITIKEFWNDFELSIDEIRDLILKTQRLFCLLTGFNLNIEYTWVICSNNDQGLTWVPFYFVHSFNERMQLSSWHDAMLSSRYLFNSNKWSTIFTRYFRSTNIFSDLWVRLVAMTGYEGFWEYEILGYVSILNRYVEMQCKNKCNKLDDIEYNNLKKCILNSVDQYAVDNKLVGNGVIESIKNDVQTIPNSDIVTFNDQFKSVISSLDSRISEILRFSEADFKRLKKIRDAVAHGKGIENTSGDYTVESKLKDKLFLLLMHFAYLDLGLTVEDQIDCLYHTWHPAKRNADINEKKLDLESGYVKEIEIEAHNFPERDTKSLYVLEFDSSRNKYAANIEKTEIVNAGHNNPLFTGLNDMKEWVKLLYPQDSILRVEWINNAYIKSVLDKTSQKTYSICVVHLKTG
jgi:hypothetical protein